MPRKATVGMEENTTKDIGMPVLIDTNTCAYTDTVAGSYFVRIVKNLGEILTACWVNPLL